MKNSEKYERAFNYFKKSYSYKMGGTQNVILPNGKSKLFDDKEVYSGRGAKYNKNINYDIIGDVNISQKEYSEFLKYLKKQKENFEKTLNEQKAKEKRIIEAKEKGIYSIDEYNYVELSDNSFDAQILANTLNIKIQDAQLLHSQGKTYVFAKKINSNKIFKLYHPHLDCNDLSINIEEVTQEYFNEFKKDWLKYSNETNLKNHFVC
ncbi:MAG: hypothetical protein ACTSUT_03120 [Promethearchaeota archaeon]